MSAGMWMAVGILTELLAAGCGYAYAPPVHARYSPRWRAAPQWLTVAATLVIVGLGMFGYGLALDLGWALPWRRA